MYQFTTANGTHLTHANSAHADVSTYTKTTFWSTLPRPIIGLAPMDGVTDHPFRYIQKRYGQVPLVYTEFTSVEGLCHGNKRVLRDFLYDETQRPIIAQIYGHTVDFFYQGAIMLCQLGFDGIDINMGCPAKSVVHSGSGAGLIRTPKLAQSIVRATQQGVRDWQAGASVRDCANIRNAIAQRVEDRAARLSAPYCERERPVPVSVKTRIGFDVPVVEPWIGTLLETEPAAIGIHGRTLNQGYSGRADWDEIERAVEVARGSGVPILGNGDVMTLEQADQRVADTGVNGVLIGRAAFGNPFVFQGRGTPTEGGSRQRLAPQLLQIALEHAQLYEQTFGHEKKYRFHPMRKHLGWYVKGIRNGARMRADMVRAESAVDVAEIVQRYLPGVAEELTLTV